MTKSIPDEEAIFHAARKMNPEARQSYLDQACSGNEKLRTRIDALLRIHKQSEPFLHTSDLSSRGQAEPDILEKPGSVIGPYRLIKPLGQGGMGTVWLAEQEAPVRRTVALKVIKPGMDSAQVIARFEAERQALALMDHPHIARVLDAGTTASGRPFFVMELVQGSPITHYCDENRLSLRERLALFVPVCQAVQHAHQKGIIHRDIKPTNVLVATFDGNPLPKVIDFGVAKAIGQSLTERTLETGLGAIVGTLEYMSPEQADFNAQDVDTRTDVYSLGVLLYELLTGSTPLTKQRIQLEALSEVLRIIREEEPAIPSSRLTDARDTLPSVSAQRSVEPARLTREVRGELDWIVMRGLEKDRARRYETASGLAQDIERFLREEPVEAGPPSVTYKLRKFARRHRRLLLTAAAFALLVLVAATVSIWQAVRATLAERAAVQARDQAVSEKERADEQTAVAETVNDFLNEGLLYTTSPLANADRDLKLRTILDRASTSVETRFAERPLVEARLRLTLGNAYRSLGELSVGERHMVRARDLYAKHEGPEHRDTLWVANNLGLIWLEQNRLDEALKLLEETFETQKRVFGLEHRDTLRTMGNLAEALKELGHLPRSRALIEQNLELRRRLLGPEHADTLSAVNNLAIVLTSQGELLKAKDLYEQILPIERRVLGAEHPGTLGTMHNLGVILTRQGKNAEASRLFADCLELDRRVLGAEHPETLLTMYNLAYSFETMGRIEEAIQLYEKTLPLQCRVLGESHSNTLNTQNNLAWLLATAEPQTLRKPPEALDMMQKVIPHRPKSANAWNSLGVARYRAGEWAASIEALEKSNALAPGRYVAHNGYFLAMANWQLGHRDKAKEWFDKAAAWTKKYDPANEELGRFRADAATLLSREDNGARR
jgi:serine/threonine protein kinase/tetratricopeptide (TPR) repeat protein